MAQIRPIRYREFASIISKNIYNDFLYLLEFERKFGKIVILCNFLIGAGLQHNNNPQPLPSFHHLPCLPPPIKLSRKNSPQILDYSLCY